MGVPPKPTVDQIKEDAPIVNVAEAEQAVDEDNLFESKKESSLHTAKRLDEELENLKQDRNLRKNYAKKIRKLVTTWVFFLFLVIIASGYSSFTKFLISDAVIIALVGGSTASIIGLYLVVVNYLFPKRN